MRGWAIERRGKLVPGTMSLIRAWSWDQFNDRRADGWRYARGLSWSDHLARLRRLGYRAVRVTVTREAAKLRKRIRSPGTRKARS